MDSIHISIVPHGDSYELLINGSPIVNAWAKPMRFDAVGEAQAYAHRLIEHDRGHRLQVVAVGLSALMPKECLPPVVAAFLRAIHAGMTRAQVSDLARDTLLQPQWSPSGNGFGTIHKLSVRTDGLTVALMFKMAPIHRASASCEQI